MNESVRPISCMRIKVMIIITLLPLLSLHTSKAEKKGQKQ